MKILNKLLIVVFCMGLCFACSDLGDDLTDDLKSGKLGASKDGETKMVTVPLKAHFYTKRDYSKEDELLGYCTEDPFLGLNYQVGEGEATHLGHFTTEMQFCGNGFLYKNGIGVMVAANGDELYFDVPTEGEIGEVILFDDPFYEAYFEDPFTITGGTGRFENASGGGITNSKVDLFDDSGNYIPEHKTDHVWTGTITMMKGKDKPGKKPHHPGKKPKNDKKHKGPKKP